MIAFFRIFRTVTRIVVSIFSACATVLMLSGPGTAVIIVIGSVSPDLYDPLISTIVSRVSLLYVIARALIVGIVVISVFSVTCNIAAAAGYPAAARIIVITRCPAACLIVTAIAGYPFIVCIDI